MGGPLMIRSGKATNHRTVLGRHIYIYTIVLQIPKKSERYSERKRLI